MFLMQKSVLVLNENCNDYYITANAGMIPTVYLFLQPSVQ